MKTIRSAGAGLGGAAGIAALLVGALPLAGAPPAAPAPAMAPPRLVLLLVVDGLRALDLERFSPLFDGGLRRLMDRGVRFADAHHEHAVTTTSPGHATLATGLHPRRHGIIDNWWHERDPAREVSSVGDAELGASPRRLLAPTLGDWLKERDPSSRVFAVSGKDTAAVLLGGHRADGAFWYDPANGGFRTSEYYRQRRPDWLTGFNEQRLLDEHFGRAWEPLPVDAETIAQLEIAAPEPGARAAGFRHLFGGLAAAPDEGFYGSVYYSPWLDAHLARCAERLATAEDLGGDGVVDLLAVSFSTLDEVGHTHGPDSREWLDLVLRLDRTIGELLDALDRTVGRDRILVALSSDHGMAPLPEVRARRGLAGRRADSRDVLCLQAVGRGLAERFGDDRWLLPGPFLDPEAVRRSGRDRDAVEREAVRLFEQCPAVVKAWTRDELRESGAAPDPYQERFARGFHPPRSPDFQLQFEEHFVRYTDGGTDHGSPYSYDTHVPLILSGARLAPGRIDERVSTSDLAPTLAALAGVPPPAGLDGRDLSALLPPAPPDARAE